MIVLNVFTSSPSQVPDVCRAVRRTPSGAQGGGTADISSASSTKAEPPPSPDVTHTFLTFGSPNLQSGGMGVSGSGNSGGVVYGDGSPASEGLRHCFSDRSPGLAPASGGGGPAADPPVVLAPLNDGSGGGGGWTGGGGVTSGGGQGQGTPSLPSAQWLLSPLMGCRDSPGPFSCLRSRWAGGHTHTHTHMPRTRTRECRWAASTFLARSLGRAWEAYGGGVGCRAKAVCGRRGFAS